VTWWGRRSGRQLATDRGRDGVPNFRLNHLALAAVVAEQSQCGEEPVVTAEAGRPETGMDQVPMHRALYLGVLAKHLTVGDEPS